MRFIALMIVVLLAAGAWAGNDVFWRKPPADAQTVMFSVPQGVSAASITDSLKQADLISQEMLFHAYLRLTGAASDLKAGSYALQRGMSVAAIVNILTESTSSDRRITLLEGWGIREMGEYLVAQGALKNVEEWYAVVGTPPSAGQTTRAAAFEEFTFLSALPEHATLEGFLFPDTYRVALDASAEDIARTMLTNFNRRVAPDEIARSGKNLYEVATLASIVEREVRSDEDRKMVADLFLRRMEEGMALQADSTVNYVTGKKTPALSIADRDHDTPWNTYLHRGLPPSPISNPSLSSIRAVLDPTPNSYVYFLTDAEGQVHYARTFAEHVANKERYLR